MATAYTNIQHLKNIQLQVKLLRVYNGRILILFFLWGQSVAHQTLTFNLLWTCLALLATYGLLSISNYLYDQHIDKANKKVNPFGKIPFSQINVLYYSCITVLVVSVAASPNNGVVLLSVMAILAIGFAYSHPLFRFSDRPVTKILSMSMVYTFLPALVGMYPLYTTSNLLTLLSVCLLASSWFLYSDIRDIPGDLLHNKRTVANTLGVEKTALLAAGVGTTSYLLLLSTSGEITPIKYVVALLPLCQWMAYFNQRLLTNRKSLAVMNVLWIVALLAWIGESSF